mgnify:CR=1 FL=1
MPQSHSSLPIHIIFGVKNRASILPAALLPRLCSYIGGIARNLDCVLLAGNGMPDHLHLLVSMHPTRAPAAVVRDVKANSSSWVKEQTGHTFAWQAGYGVFAVSASLVPKVRVYIQSQQQHHRRVSYRQEYERFLERHGIECDRRDLPEEV